MTKDDKATITKLKKQLTSANREVLKASALFSSIGEGIIVTNEYGIIEQVNKRAEETLGFDEGELIGKHFVETIKVVNEDGSVADPMDRPITRAFLYGKPISDRVYSLTPGNEIIPIDTNVSPLMIDGSPCGAVILFHDLTDEYFREKLQSEFISIASHQLRTPLSSINTYSQMLSQGYAGQLNKRQANFVSVIENSANRMNELIHALLNVSRIEAGNITVNVKNVEVDAMCKEIIGSLLPIAEDRGVEIDYCNGVISSIETDPILLREILSNLISNAIKYTPNGGSIDFKVKAKDRVIFSIKDNGYGIPDGAKNMVFSKFYRAKNVTHYDVSGTGIGLYLAKQIADRLEGDLWFSSEVNRGSTFYFSLPLTGSAKKQGRFSLQIPS